jgi:hypothetical protein
MFFWMTPESNVSFLLQAKSNSNDATSTGILNENGLIIIVLIFYIVKSREKDMFWYNTTIVFNAKVPMRKWRFPTRIWYLRHVSNKM